MGLETNSCKISCHVVVYYTNKLAYLFSGFWNLSLGWLQSYWWSRTLDIHSAVQRSLIWVHWLFEVVICCYQQIIKIGFYIFHTLGELWHNILRLYFPQGMNITVHSFWALVSSLVWCDNNPYFNPVLLQRQTLPRTGWCLQSLVLKMGGFEY